MLLAFAFPILPGKTDEWHEWMTELTGPRYDEFAESRRRLGIHERTFLQPTPMGDLVIVTLEGEDPGRAFAQFLSGTDAFTTWFVAKGKEIHGIDLTAPLPALPQLVADSERAPVLA